MKIVRGIKQMQEISGKLRVCGKGIGFVPTMGALHAGHLSLIAQARRDCDFVVVSIFINPLQFGPQEDFKNYPRVFKQDAAICRKAGVDCLFYPGFLEMYPQEYKTYVIVEGLSDKLCGKFRPGHFRGVATVVAKLFNIVSPSIAYFGQKDAQQAVIIRKMATDLNLPVRIKVMPTLREQDGLAMSSRNRYLTPEQRQDALSLSLSLKLARALVISGVKDSSKVIIAIRQLLGSKQKVKIEYVSIVNVDTLEPLKKIFGKCLICLAARVGKTRLIDNILIGS